MSILRNLYRMLHLLLCAACLQSVVAHAEPVPDLYAVTVPVAGQAQSDLQRAAAIGARELAVRMTGRSAAAGDPALAPLFAKALNLLDQYRFERNPSSGDLAWLAQLRFAAPQFDNELRRAGQPLWGANRPALLAVIAIEDKNGRALVTEESPYANTLREQWRRRGLLLHLPVNAKAVRLDDVLHLDAAKLAAGLTERSDGLVIGRVLLASNGNCQSSWLLNFGSQPQSVDATGGDLSTCAANALDRIVDSFSAQYAVASNASAEGVVLRIVGLNNFDDYAAALNALRHLAVIKTAQPLSLQNDEVLFQLTLAGNAEQLVRQLALDTRLSPADNPANSAIPVTYSFRWVAASAARAAN